MSSVVFIIVKLCRYNRRNWRYSMNLWMVLVFLSISIFRKRKNVGNQVEKVGGLSSAGESPLPSLVPISLGFSPSLCTSSPCYFLGLWTASNHEQSKGHQTSQAKWPAYWSLVFLDCNQPLLCSWVVVFLAKAAWNYFCCIPNNENFSHLL